MRKLKITIEKIYKDTWAIYINGREYDIYNTKRMCIEVAKQRFPDASIIVEVTIQ